MINTNDHDPLLSDVRGHFPTRAVEWHELPRDLGTRLWS